MREGETYFLRTQRLGFRCWSESDWPLAKDLWGDERATALIGGPFTESQIRQRLKKEIAWMTRHQVQYWPLFLFGDTRDEHVGCAGLRPYKIEDRCFELGVLLAPASWGCGLAEEACRAVIDYTFRRTIAESIFAGHHPANHGSKKLITKLGFRYTHDEFYEPTGLMHPSYLLIPSGEYARDCL